MEYFGNRNYCDRIDHWSSLSMQKKKWVEEIPSRFISWMQCFSGSIDTLLNLQVLDGLTVSRKLWWYTLNNNYAIVAIYVYFFIFVCTNISNSLFSYQMSPMFNNKYAYSCLVVVLLSEIDNLIFCWVALHLHLRMSAWQCNNHEVFE